MISNLYKQFLDLSKKIWLILYLIFDLMYNPFKRFIDFISNLLLIPILTAITPIKGIFSKILIYIYKLYFTTTLQINKLWVTIHTLPAYCITLFVNYFIELENSYLVYYGRYYLWLFRQFLKCKLITDGKRKKFFFVSWGGLL